MALCEFVYLNACFAFCFIRHVNLPTSNNINRAGFFSLHVAAAVVFSLVLNIFFVF